MRFKISDENIRIEPGAGETEAIVLALADVMIPRWTPTLYFTSHRRQNYPAIEQRAADDRRLRTIKYDDFNKTLLGRCRIVEHEDGTLYVADPTHSLNVNDRREICHQLQERLAR